MTIATVTLPKKFKRFEKIVERKFNRELNKPENLERLKRDMDAGLRKTAKEMIG